LSASSIQYVDVSVEFDVSSFQADAAFDSMSSTPMQPSVPSLGGEYLKTSMGI
jgi:hypothetical protein